MVGMIIKTINGSRYEYYEYFQDGKTIQKYCGPEGSVKARKMALELEYDILKKKKADVIEMMKKNREESQDLR